MKSDCSALLERKNQETRKLETENTTMSEEKGPSKNELKKMAKKAEKAAKKAATKAGGAAPAQDDKKADGIPATASSATTTPIQLPSAPKILLYQGAKDDPATLKLVWAALQYNIPVGVAKKKDLPLGCPTSSKKSILVYGTGDYVLGGGGNAMVKAIGLMAGEALSFEADEWCEVERNTLRNANKLKLDSLATGLENTATGIHLVGEADTIADICVLVTLSKHEGEMATWPGKFFFPFPEKPMSEESIQHGGTTFSKIVDCSLEKNGVIVEEKF